MRILVIVQMTRENNKTEYLKCFDSNKKRIPWNKGKGKGEYIHQGYRWIRIPPESGDRFAHLFQNFGFIAEHRLVWELTHDACLLKWADVHHINIHNLTPEENKLDNSPENLAAMMDSEHLSLHKKAKRKDMSGRRCELCGSDTTYIMKRTERPDWRRYKNGFICSRYKCRQTKKKRIIN